MNRITPENIQSLEPNEVFVFGSNESGMHGAGAARLARTNFGATPGQGFGLSGRSFAIPTKDWTIQTLPVEVIALYVERFIAHTKNRQDLLFLVTEIGCGLAGYTPEQIAPLFIEVRARQLSNVSLPIRFWNILNKQHQQNLT